MINASLIFNKTREVIVNKKANYTVTPDGVNDTITLTVPEDEKEGLYACILYLYNSTGRINEIIELNVEGDSYNDTNQSSNYLYPLSEPSWNILIVIILILITVILLSYYCKRKRRR